MKCVKRISWYNFSFTVKIQSAIGYILSPMNFAFLNRLVKIVCGSNHIPMIRHEQTDHTLIVIIALSTSKNIYEKIMQKLRILNVSLP